MARAAELQVLEEIANDPGTERAKPCSLIAGAHNEIVRRQWSDRKQKITVPLFSGYLFVRMNMLKDSKLQVLKIPGIVSFVGNSNGPILIPDRQIDDIRTLPTRGVEFEVCPYVERGDRVRVVRGVMAGVEGTYIRANSCSRLVTSVEMIHQSVAVSVSRQDVEPVNRCAA